MGEKLSKKYDDLGIIEKRVAYYIGARVRDKDRVEHALREQDKIREKHPQQSDWDSVAQIRKLREAE